MPTGYTYMVSEGADFKTFALACARGMGALITMRDDPADAPIPDKFEPNTQYCDERIAGLQAEIAKLSSMSLQECANEQTQEIAAARDYQDAYITKREEQAKKYTDMIEQVEAWHTEAEGIKEFMLEQLRTSLEHDCGGSYLPDIPKQLPADEWRFSKINAAVKNLEYYMRERQREIERAENRTRWIKAFKESLEGVAS
jgi:hypothetical protein